MTELDQALVRRLAEWTPGDVPVTSLYLSVDGRRLPRKVDYELRLDEAVRRARDLAANLDKRARGSVEGDCAAIVAFVRERFERGSTRGLALFSSSSNGSWEDVEIPRPVRNLVDVGPSANVLQLEAILETYPTTCTALVDHQHARLFLARLGRIEEISEVSDDVPNRHDQGGLAQMRLQRHVDDHRHKHLKHVADELFRLQERRHFDHLVLAGATEVVAELERELHDYVAQRVLARIVLPMTASAREVLDRSLELDEKLEAKREREEAERLLEAVAARRGAVGGLDGVLDAVWETRAGELLVDDELRHPGSVCSTCGRLASTNGACSACRGRTEAVPDVVETGVAVALRQGCRIETITQDGLLAEVGGIGAFLRF
jgi:peptide chain release factor subunit 1